MGFSISSNRLVFQMIYGFLISEEQRRLYDEMSMKKELELMGVNTGSDPEVWGCFKACQHKLSKTNMTLILLLNIIVGDI